MDVAHKVPHFNTLHHSHAAMNISPCLFRRSIKHLAHLLAAADPCVGFLCPFLALAIVYTHFLPFLPFLLRSRLLGADVAALLQ